MELLILISSIFFIAFLKYCYKADKLPIFGIYRQPNRWYWLKVFFVYIVLNIQKIIRELKGIFFDKSSDFSQFEKAQKLSFHDKAVDAVYFNGTNEHGDVLILGTARRKNCLVNGFIILNIERSGLGFLELPKQPDTCLYQDEEIEEFAAENLKIEPLIPMKKWKITYKGLMKKRDCPNEKLEVEIEAIWQSAMPIFNFDTDVDILSMAKSLALEKWTRNYFQLLKNVHQTHYEQFGETECKIKINNVKYDFNLGTVRDHTFGKIRNWRHFYRYVLHLINLENGDRIMATSICCPIVFSSLNVGYYYCKTEGKNYPISDLDFKLYQHGENGITPKDYAFSFKSGSKTCVVQVNVLDSIYFYLEKDRQAKVIELISKFKVNDIKGWGVCEYEYHNLK